MQYVIFFYPHPRTCLLILERGEGREKERERNLNVSERHRLAASQIRPDQGPNPQPRRVPWPGIGPKTFWCTGRCSHQVSPTGQGCHVVVLTAVATPHIPRTDWLCVPSPPSLICSTFHPYLWQPPICSLCLWVWFSSVSVFWFHRQVRSYGICCSLTSLRMMPSVHSRFH